MSRKEHQPVMRSPVASFGLPLALGFLCLPLSAQTSGVCQAPVNVGYRVVTFSGGLKAGVWYPTSSAVSVYQYSSQTSGLVARDGAVADCGRIPLVLFSHGFGGCGIQSVFFTEELARHGYIVAAPDHKDALCSVDGTGSFNFTQPQESFLDPASWTPATYSDRRDDLLATLSGLMGSADFANRLDPSRVGASGHSLGGYAAAGIAGAWPSWQDSRIQAALLFSPYILPFLVQHTLGLVNVPVMYQGATFDIGITPFLTGAGGAYEASNPPKFFAELNGGSHFEWTNLVCAGEPSVAGCLAAKPNAKLIDDYGIAFLDRYLKGIPQSLLTGFGAGLAMYQRAALLTGVSAASYQSNSPVAPESIVSGFGDGLSTQTAAADNLVLPTLLAASAVSIRDSQGIVRSAPLYYVSPGMINFVVPQGTASGNATVSVTSGGQVVAAGNLSIAAVAPSLFSANSSGGGVADGQYLRNNQFGLLFDPKTLLPVPVNLTASPDQVFLVLYGTGLRGVRGGAAATVGGVSVPVIGPVAQPTYAGLDQVNLGPLPLTLAGRGAVDIVLIVDGVTANTVTATF